MFNDKLLTQVSSIYPSGDPSERFSVFERCILQNIRASVVEKDHLYIPLDYNTNIIPVLVEVKESVLQYVPVVQL